MYKKTVFILLLATKVSAVPSLYPTSISDISRIKNPTTSSVIIDNVDSKRFYVLPPSVAEAKVTGLHTRTTNLGFCREMAALTEYSFKISQKIFDMEMEVSSEKAIVDEAFKNLSNAKEEASRHTTLARLQDLAELDANILENESRLSDLYTQSNSCNNSCEQINTEIDSLVRHKNEQLKLRREIAKNHSVDLRVYERNKAKVAAANDNYEYLEGALRKLTTNLNQVRNDFHQMYGSFAKMEGARAAISFQSSWNDNVAKLRTENPNYSFEKIHTQNAQVISSLSASKSLPGAQAILDYEFGGQNADGILKLPSYPESFQGNIVLSLVGACPQVYPELFKLNPADETMTYGMVVSYEFPTVFSVDVTATYNMYKMYQKIVQSGSSGGFFSSRSWSAVEEKNFFRDSFVVKWNEQDPLFSLPDDQKALYEKELRSAILERVASLALPLTPDRNAILKSAAAPKHGGVVLANSLTTACPGNMYCIGASIALNVLDAIFGSSSTASSYMQTYNIELVDQYSRSKVMYKPAITSYK